MLEYSTQEKEIELLKGGHFCCFQVFPDKEKVDVKFNQIHTFCRLQQNADPVG